MIIKIILNLEILGLIKVNLRMLDLEILQSIVLK